MHLQTDRALIPANAPAVRRYLHVAISAPAQPATAGGGAARTPVDVALVLDRSGSMGGPKFDMARTAVEHAVRLLKPDDRLGVACYDEGIVTVLDRTPATKEAKTLALQRLAEHRRPRVNGPLRRLAPRRRATWPAARRPTRPAWPRCCCSPTAWPTTA